MGDGDVHHDCQMVGTGILAVFYALSDLAIRPVENAMFEGFWFMFVVVACGVSGVHDLHETGVVVSEERPQGL